MKQIPLTQGLFATIDDADYERVSQHKWCAHVRRIRKTSYAVSYINGKLTSLHRFIMGLEDGKVWVDHIDGNGLNNQRSNLRICTRNQNQQNRPKNKNNKSGHKGVFWDSSRSKWGCAIMVNRKKIMLGRFDDLEFAAFVYQEAARKYHGEFANA